MRRNLLHSTSRGEKADQSTFFVQETSTAPVRCCLVERKRDARLSCSCTAALRREDATDECHHVEAASESNGKLEGLKFTGIGIMADCFKLLQGLAGVRGVDSACCVLV